MTLSNWNRAHALGLTLALALGGAFELPSAAHSQDIIERVVAVVNDEAIWLSEVRKRAMPFLEAVLDEPTDVRRDAALQTLYVRIAKELVNEELIEEAAREMQLRVTNAEIDRGIENLQTQNGLTEDQFWQAVGQQGFTETEYRRAMRRQVLRLKVLNTRLRDRINVSEAEVREVYEQQIRRASRRRCFALDVRPFRVDPEAPDGDPTLACAEAQRVSETATPETFGGQDVGVVCEGAMPAALEEAVSELQPGDISTPIPTEGGCLVVRVRSQETGAGDVPEYDAMKEAIYRDLVNRAMAREEPLFLDELRRNAVVDERL